ncbi:Hypothetical predicted protein [Pelobates cultripes]|uniref:Uncharacterized protein n=1 Tax=Pelobates cultripes TaxID=61616 RepID=A0AAD1WI55_PELCU|nr:Hypothetical predicted protein [Pelobates cultripes]
MVRGLLDELRHNIAADIGQFREEIRQGYNTELNTADHETRIKSLENQLLTLQHTQTQAQDRLESLEDKRHLKNIKIRCLPDNLEPTEFPHLFRRLLTVLFSAKRAKLMPLDGWYKIPKPATGTQRASRDIKVRFQQSQDRLVFMAATRNRSPFNFEEHSLTFFPDLTRATLEWRRSLRPLTTELLAHKMPWSLIIPRDSGDLKNHSCS